VHEYAGSGGSTRYEAVATLEDGLGRQAHCRVPIEVQGVPNRPPVIDAFTAAPASIAVGQSSALSAFVIDPDPGDTTTWSLSLGGPGSLSPTRGTGPIVSTFTASASGIVTIDATATDSHGASTRRSVTVSVAPSNQPPVITSLVAIPPLLFAQVGGLSSIQGPIADPDGDAVTWTFELVAGGVCSLLGPLSGSGPGAATTLFVTPSLIGGSCLTRLTARDPGGLTATRTVIVHVAVAP
jgi:hypothetical protein